MQTLLYHCFTSIMLVLHVSGCYIMCCRKSAALVLECEKSWCSLLLWCPLLHHLHFFLPANCRWFLHLLKLKINSTIFLIQSLNNVLFISFTFWKLVEHNIWNWWFWFAWLIIVTQCWCQLSVNGRQHSFPTFQYGSAHLNVSFFCCLENIIMHVICLTHLQHNLSRIIFTFIQQEAGLLRVKLVSIYYSWEKWNIDGAANQNNMADRTGVLVCSVWFYWKIFHCFKNVAYQFAWYFDISWREVKTINWKRSSSKYRRYNYVGYQYWK